MSRKDASFDQLITYVNREVSDQAYSFHHNLLGRTPEEVIAEMGANAALMRKRKNGVVMYHEIVSITRAKGLPERRQKELLLEITQSYVARRAPYNLVYGALHDDKADNLHMHVVISANQLGSEKRHRLTKKQFQAIKLDMEAKVLARHPELEQKVAINKKAAIALSDAGHEVKRRTRRTPKRDAAQAKLGAIMKQADSKNALLAALDEAGFELYFRGRHAGVIDRNDKGRKYRLKTLGLDKDFKALTAREEKKANRAEKKAAAPEMKQQVAQQKTVAPPPTKIAKDDSSMGLEFFGVVDLATTIADLTMWATELEDDRDQKNEAKRARTREDKPQNENAQEIEPKKQKVAQIEPKKEKVAKGEAGKVMKPKEKTEQAEREAVIAERKAEMEELRREQTDTKKKDHVRKR